MTLLCKSWWKSACGVTAMQVCRDVPGSRGFALVVVLWWLALLTLLLTQIASSSHTEELVATNIRSAAIAEAAADGAVNQAIFQVLTHHWAPNGASHLVRGQLAVAEVRVEDEASKLDPNVTPVTVMRALLRVCGAAPPQAERLATAISQWRSLDILHRADVDLTVQYREAGLGYIPPNKRFVSEDELGLVVGMTPALLACLAPHISVYSVSVPSLQTTNDPVIRQALLEAYPEDAVRPAAASVYEITVIRISAVAQTTSGGKFRRTAMVRLVSAPEEHFAYKILSWEAN
jgi:general secretion pathway protein K